MNIKSRRAVTINVCLNVFFHPSSNCTLGYKIFISFVATISGIDTTEEVPSSLLLSEQMVSECVVDFLYNFYSFAAFHSV